MKNMWQCASARNHSVDMATSILSEEEVLVPHCHIQVQSHTLVVCYRLNPYNESRYEIVKAYFLFTVWCFFAILTYVKTNCNAWELDAALKG